MRLPSEKVVFEESFPSAPTGMKQPTLEKLAIQVVDSSDTSPSNDFMIATDRSGRQLFSDSNYNIVYKDRHLTTILVKSTGMPETVRHKWKEYQKATEPFFYTTKITSGDIPTGLLGKDEFMGLATKEDQELDAMNSLRLHQAGVKVRIPFGGWQVKEFRVAGQWRNIEWFKSQGYEGNELFQSVWGVTCPLRLEDVNDILTQVVSIDKDLSKLDPLLHDFIQLAKKDQSQQYQELAIKWNNVGDTLTNEQRILILIDFGIALSKTMGQNFEALSRAGLVHGNIHDGNVTFFGELCDSSTVKKGILKSGGAQKIGDDVDSFADGMRIFADKILRMQEIDTYNEPKKVEELLNKVFYSSVKEGWKSYEEWIKINVQELINNQERRQEIRLKLTDLYDESEISESMITTEILKKTGGDKRFRAYN